MKRRLLPALFALLISLPHAGAATKYVDPNGSATWINCGNRMTPCSIPTAQTNSAAGDEVIMLPGWYPSGINTATNGAAGNPITWRSETRLAAVLNGYAAGQTDKTLLIDNAYHRFLGVRVNVQTGPGGAHTYGLFATGAGWEFLDGEITFTGDEAVMGLANNAYCAQARSTGLFQDNLVHDCTYGINVFSSSAGFPMVVRRNVFRDFIVGNPENSDCMAVSGAGAYDWTGVRFEDNDCSGYRDDGLDLLFASNALSFRNQFHHPSSRGDVNMNSSCLKMGYEFATGNRSVNDVCYGLDADPIMRNYGYVFTGASGSTSESAVVIAPYRCADIAQRNGAGGVGNKLIHMTCTGATDNGVRIYAGATNTELINSVFDGALGDIFIATSHSATGRSNRRVNGTVAGSGTYNQIGDTNGDPLWVGGRYPAAVEGLRPRVDSPLCRSGVAAIAGVTKGGRRLGPSPDRGAVACPNAMAVSR